MNIIILPLHICIACTIVHGCTAQYKLKNRLQNMTAETLTKACFLYIKSHFWIPMLFTRGDLSIAVSITTVGLILTKLG